MAGASALTVGRGASPSMVECWGLASTRCCLSDFVFGFSAVAGASTAGVVVLTEGRGASPSIVLANLFFWPDWRERPAIVSKRAVSVFDPGF